MLTSILSSVHAATVNIYKPTGGLANVRGVEGVIRNVLCPLTNTMITFLMAVSVIMVIWAAYVYLTAHGDEDKIKTGHRTITYAAIAVGVALIAKGVPFIVAGVFLGTLGPGACLF